MARGGGGAAGRGGYGEDGAVSAKYLQVLEL